MKGFYLLLLTQAAALPFPVQTHVTKREKRLSGGEIPANSITCWPVNLFLGYRVARQRKAFMMVVESVL